MDDLRRNITESLCAHGGRVSLEEEAAQGGKTSHITVRPLVKAFALGRLLFMLAKPHLAAILTLHQLYQWRNGRRSSLPLLALWAFCCYRTLQEQLRLRSLPLRPGVFAFGPKSRKLCRASGLDELVESYKPPLALWNGDLLTVLPSLRQAKRLPQYTRVTFAVEGHAMDRFATDWAFPDRPWNRRVAVLIAGVGGNSKARYIVDMAEQFLAEGSIVCVLNPRGLDDSPPVQEFSQLLDSDAIAQDLSQLLAAADAAFVTPMNAKMVLIGFSQGGIIIGKYLVHAGDTAPDRLLGGIAFSGTFRAEFLSWQRYKRYYQPVIVPQLVESICAKYADRFRADLNADQERRLRSAMSYAHLFETLALPYRDDFQSFEELVEGLATPKDRKSRVARPLLMVSALDDPMHNPCMVGFETTHAHENLIYAFTSQGGHVSWATDHSGSFSWMHEVAANFTAALHEDRGE